MAIYIKITFHVTQLSSLQIPKQFELLALKLEFSHSQSLTIIGCYRPPSASHEALASLASSDDLKAVCNSLNLTQLINSSTWPNTKSPFKSSLLDLILTNVPQKYMDTGVFANDLSVPLYHCSYKKFQASKGPILYAKEMLKTFVSQLFCMT